MSAITFFDYVTEAPGPAIGPAEDGSTVPKVNVCTVPENLHSAETAALTLKF